MKAIIPEDAIIFNRNTAQTTTLKVADAFGKQHKNILRKIQTLECSAEFNRLNFEPITYRDAKGQKQPAYRMTKDGFIFLVMGLTGHHAAAIKEAYIKAFNQAQAQLARRQKPKTHLRAKYHYPKESLRPHGAKQVWLTAAVLLDPDNPHPLNDLLCQLAREGNNIEGARLEYLAVLERLSDSHQQLMAAAKCAEGAAVRGMTLNYTLSQIW